MKRIQLVFGAEHPCSYLDGLTARMAYTDPGLSMSAPLYSALAEQGFRRSGDWVYRPWCRHCSACIPVRIPVARFAPNRSQARILKRNADLTAIPRPAEFVEEHYRLYRRYLETRHADGDMEGSGREEYMQFLGSAWANTAFVEFRLGAELLAVAAVDRLSDGLSAVYTFFDPEQGPRGLGVYAVLWQVEEARALGLDWLYLGYWIEACRKMTYKSRYRPLEAWIAGQWRLFEKGGKIVA
jgi:arginine-tRNA-protein transferase